MKSTKRDLGYVADEFKRIQKPKWAKAPKMISLFAGCGGLDLPFHLAGYKNVYVNEFNKDAANTFAENFGVPVDSRPIEDVDLSKLPKADLVTGGFPCQDFSMIWKRPGLNGTRGNLYTYLLEVVNRSNPKAFIAENVLGLLTANKGAAIDQIIEDFSLIGGGYLVFPKVYNFADYGVPQYRQRVVLVGIRLDTGFNFVHPVGHRGKANQLKHRSAGEAFKGLSYSLPNSEHMKIQPKTIKLLEKIGPGGNFSDLDPSDPLYVKGMISHVYRRIDPDKPSTTLIAGGGGGTWGYHYPEPRALTNRERARLQSFPDNFEFSGSFTEVRRQLGNAVPPVGIIPIVNELNRLFSGNYTKVNLKGLYAWMQKMPTKQKITFAKSQDKIDWYEEYQKSIR